MTLVYLTLAWVAGIILGQRIAPEPFPVFWAIAACAAGLAFLRRKDRTHRLLLSCTALAALGILRMAAVSAPAGPQALVHHNGQGWASMSGVIVGEPDVRDNHVNLQVRVDSVNGDEATGHALVQAQRYGNYAYGDRVLVSGTPLTPPEFDTFSYRDYLARLGIKSLIPNARVEVIAHDQGHAFYAALFRLKARAQGIITNAIPEPQSSLLTGILLGIETGISPDVRDDFNATGASHVIAISGFNMTLIAGMLSRMLALLWPTRRRMTAAVGIMGIIVYTLFVGAGAAVVRAAVMSILLVSAPLFNRRAYVPASLAFATMIMSLLDPFVLWDIGFQLSLSAVLGLALLVPVLERGFRAALRPLFKAKTIEQMIGFLSEPLIVTLAAQITTLPLIMLYFQRVSLTSLPVNFLILPAQTPLLLLGGLAALVGLVAPVLAQPFFWGAWVFLSWTIEIVRLFASLPNNELALTIPAPTVGIFFIALLLWAIVRATRPEAIDMIRAVLRGHRLPAFAVSAGALTAVLLWAGVRALPDGLLHVSFLDSGESNAVLITTPGGSQILIDGGQYPTRLLTALGDHLPFWDRTIELVILTQPKDSQFSALPAVLEQYKVDLLMTSGQLSDTDDFAALQNAIATYAIPVQTAAAGTRVVASDGVTIEVIHPPAIPSEGSKPNDEGIVLHLEYGDATFLLTPDLSETAEDRLLASASHMQAAVLQVPTHGSDKASSQAFLERVSPQIAVVQVAPGNRFGHPAPAVMERLGVTPLFRTDESGEISFATDGQQLWMTTARTQ